MAAHLHDHRWLLDADRADFHTRATGHAGPERLGRDDITDQRGSMASGTRQRVLGVDAKIEDEIARAQRRPGCGRRTRFVAAPALRAGVEVEHVLP